MGVTTIDPRTAVLALLQARLAPLPPASRVRAPTGGQPSRLSGASGSAQAAASAVSLRIAAIDRADPERRRKAVRVVLEAEVAREFGNGLLNDPAFPEMLDAVQQQMQ